MCCSITSTTAPSRSTSSPACLPAAVCGLGFPALTASLMPRELLNPTIGALTMSL